MTRYFAFAFVCIALSVSISGAGAAENPAAGPDISAGITALKNDPKGPFQGIRWFCPGGKVLPAKEPCPSGRGYQHGLLKEWVQKLEKEPGIYLNAVLAGMPEDHIWTPETRHSRLKQYVLLQYLINADDGWIFRKARYYRGALQAEDEERWGGAALHRILASEKTVSDSFLMAREACRAVPHVNRNRNRLQTIRSLSKKISEKNPDFMTVRIKIHGQPEAGDLTAVRQFMEQHETRTDPEQLALLQRLAAELEDEYRVSPDALLEAVLSRDSLKNPALADTLSDLNNSKRFIMDKGISPGPAAPNPYADMARLLLDIRQKLPQVPAELRLPLMDASLELENVLILTVANWQPQSLGQLLSKTRALAMAAAGCGYIESWEWQAFDQYQPLPAAGEMNFADFRLKAEQVRRVVDWGVSMIRAVYGKEVSLFSSFAPLVQGFFDDRVRSSILLPFGESAGQLSRTVQKISGIAHTLPKGVGSGGVRGMNTGLAFGTLIVVEDEGGPARTDSKNIYLFRHIPADLKPVAGILSVSEGNLVSHVQLLARNLGIPNAAVTPKAFEELKSLNGQKVLFAVSQKGRVVMKPEGLMTDAEKSLVIQKERSRDLFTVPVQRINLAQAAPVRLSSVRAQDSGRLCGPKAANLGQLKFQFPGTVGEGIIIPFGVFRRHMDQVMPGTDQSFWQFLTRTLAAADQSEADRISRLAELQAAIRTMPFLPGFEADLNTLFTTALGGGVGQVPVFIRSDTNMEDIKEFTGAGLNLTLFNVREPESILKGIREVWASPYTERSYLWRQKYLNNPANVYPSILLLPSVNVERSGVIITHGILSGHPQDITVAFCRGVGGAVEGQTAESYLLTAKGEDIMIHPSREMQATRTPALGGVTKEWVRLDIPVLGREDRKKIRELVATVRKTLPGTPGIEGEGPFDIEMGFLDGKIRLFQVRPFIENKKAGMLTYLLQLDTGYAGPETISAERTLD